MQRSKYEGSTELINWDGFSDEQHKKAIQEMSEEWERSNFEHQSVFEKDFCLNNGINYATYKKWINGDTNIQKKQKARIEIAVTRRCGMQKLALCDLPSIGEKVAGSQNKNYLEESSAKLIELYKSADGVKTEFIYVTGDMPSALGKIKTALEKHAEFWNIFKEADKTNLSSMEAIDKQIKVLGEAKKFIETINDQGITLHVGFVHKIFLTKDLKNKNILIVCFNAIPKQRNDIQRDDVRIRPNLENVENVDWRET
jgi:hypothetical protein